jgi:DNA-binding transcriptional regulator YiaG
MYILKGGTMTKEELRAWRDSTGYSQGQLAKALNVSVITVSRWETGTRSVPSFLMLALRQLESTDDPANRRLKGKGKDHGSNL